MTKRAPVHNKLVVGPPKTAAGIRGVTVAPHVAQLLREHMKAHTGAGPESFLFTTTRAAAVSDRVHEVGKGRVRQRGQARYARA